MLKVEERSIVVPGDVLAEGMDMLPSFGTIRDGENIISTRVGLIRTRDNAVKVLPLSGRYSPQEGDYIIGKVDEVSFSNWFININSPYDGTLPLALASNDYIDRKEDLANYYGIGDVVFAKIDQVTKNKSVNLTMKDYRARKLKGGRIVEITPYKVPRLIGKKGSMIETIKKHTGCNIVVGQNGWVWIKGDDEELAAEAVQMVENQSHLEGLTSRIKEFLTENSRQEDSSESEEQPEENQDQEESGENQDEENDSEEDSEDQEDNN